MVELPFRVVWSGRHGCEGFGRGGASSWSQSEMSSELLQAAERLRKARKHELLVSTGEKARWKREEFGKPYISRSSSLGAVFYFTPLFLLGHDADVFTMISLFSHWRKHLAAPTMTRGFQVDARCSPSPSPACRHAAGRPQIACFLGGHGRCKPRDRRVSSALAHLSMSLGPPRFALTDVFVSSALSRLSFTCRWNKARFRELWHTCTQ